MRFLNPWRKKDTRGNKMPPELVEAIKGPGLHLPGPPD